MLILLLPAKISENAISVMKCILQSQKVFHPFVKISLTSQMIFSLMNIIFIAVLDFGLIVIVFAMYIIDIVELYLYIRFIRIYIPSEYLKGLLFQK